jgi:DNA-binding NtrC family response regulator
VSARRLLVVDDDALFCDALRDAFAVEGVEVVAARGIEAARELAAQGFAVVVVDNHLADGDGLSLVPALLRADPRARVILCTAFPGLDTAVAALRLGIFDYVTKPVDLAALTAIVCDGLRDPASPPIEPVDEPRKPAADRPQIVGRSASAASLRAMITRAAGARAPVLITGETGTGKTLVARAIHAEGCASRPFVHVNCAALPEGLVESELFGSERGSFTGASQAREGLFELADGGTLFLDEVGELAAPIQAKLLMALEEGWIRRVGGARARRVNARILAATNADVEGAVERGALRADLYYRLNVVRLDLPPLRACPEDVPELCAHLLAHLTCGRGATLAEGELATLTAHAWPGNTRELRNVLERALVLQSPGALRPSALLSAAPRRASAEPASLAPVSLAEHERRHVLEAVERSEGNRARAARALGVSVVTLRRKLREYGETDNLDPVEGSL